MDMLTSFLCDPSCLTNYAGRRRFATPGEARAAERGFADFPRRIEDSAAYITGWHDADAFERVREESRAERAQARRDE